MNIADIAILAGVAVALFFALRSIRARKKKGCGCGCGCEGCRQGECGKRRGA